MIDIKTCNVNNIFRLDGKVAIITGASRGLGKAIALGYAAVGAKVVLAARSIESLKKTEKEIKTFGAEALAVKTDVTHYDDLKKLVSETLATFNNIDILVNCCGQTKSALSHEYCREDWDLIYKTNLKSAFELCQLVGRVMIKNKSGSIINITSIAAELASPSNPAYNATKGGLRQLTKGLAADWGEFNIRANNLGPGYFNTELNSDSWSDPEKRKARANRCVLNRWGETSEIIGPAIFLASDASSFITGQDIYVDGGFLIKSL